MDVQFCEQMSYFSRYVSMVPHQGEISSKEEEQLWLEEKKLWMSSKGEDLAIVGNNKTLDDTYSVEFESELEKKRDERPA